MERKSIDVESLVLSENNPRLEPSFEENEVIVKMVENQGNKLFELASDIVVHGLNPLDTIAVFPSENYNGFFEVGEGNRRICAIKLLTDPSILVEVNSSLFQKFSSLSKEYKRIQQIEVCVFENKESLRHWMEIRHLGEQKGKGTAKWDSVQKERYNRSQSGSNALLDFWDWLIAKGVLSKEEIECVTKTNWQRVLRDRYFPFLKIQYEGSFSVLPQNLDVFSERIRAVQNALAGKSVAIVYDKEKIDEFYDSISEKLYGRPFQEIVQLESCQFAFVSNEDSTETELDDELSDDKQLKTSSSEDTAEANPDDEQNEADLTVDYDYDNTGDSETTNNQNNTLTVGRDVFNGCKTIIPRTYPIRSDNMRVNKIIKELKQLEVDFYPNACGTLLRALFELSAKVFLERQDNTDHTGTDFLPAIKNAANELRTQGRITNSQHSAIMSDVDNLRKIFNGYMHDTDGYPSSEALKNFFKSHRRFIEECQK